nr:hypothetical protein [Tanacetum cinerariifolium]
MSDNIPFEIQMEIIEKVYDVKSLIHVSFQTMEVFFVSYEFIKGYGVRHTQPHSHILNYKVGYLSDPKFFCLVDDDDNETFKVQHQEFAPFVRSPLLKQFSLYEVVGVCHRLMSLYGFHKDYKNGMVVIWNPSIGKSFGILVPGFVSLDFGFGVCPITRDPTIVNILCTYKMMPWYIEVFTLSSGVWNVILCSKLPRQSIKLNTSTQVVIDRFIYYGAHKDTFTEHGRYTKNHMAVSFDLVTKEFKVVNLPDILTNEIYAPMSVSVCKLSGSLVVSAYIVFEGALCCGVWVMEHDSYFRKLYNIGASFDKIFGFRKKGEPIFKIQQVVEQFTTLNVYDPCLQQIKNLSIYGVEGSYGSFVIGTYKESLHLLDHLDSHAMYATFIKYVICSKVGECSCVVGEWWRWLESKGDGAVKTEEPKDSFIMGDEKLNTIPKKELDEVIKSSIEYLVPILSESEDISGSDSECDLPSCDDFSPINVLEGKSMTFSNPLFDSNDDFIFSDDESLSDEDDLNKKFYNSLGRVPNRCSSSIGKTQEVVIVL